MLSDFLLRSDERGSELLLDLLQHRRRRRSWRRGEVLVVDGRREVPNVVDDRVGDLCDGVNDGGDDGGDFGDDGIDVLSEVGSVDLGEVKNVEFLGGWSEDGSMEVGGRAAYEVNQKNEGV